MIALDTSAIVAIAVEEAEAERFDRAISVEQAVVGVPTLFEARMVLIGKMPDFAEAFMEAFVTPVEIEVVPFTIAMYRHATSAFVQFGRGRGHPAKLNMGDCMSYAVAKHYDIPLLYKGTDFGLTDIRPALS